MAADELNLLDAVAIYRAFRKAREDGKITADEWVNIGVKVFDVFDELLPPGVRGVFDQVRTALADGRVDRRELWGILEAVAKAGREFDGEDPPASPGGGTVPGFTL
jgi:hypothetical protein